MTPEELPLDEISKYETRIPLDLIRRDEKVYLERLTREIEKEGLTEPITIRVREDGSRIVWDGIHRLIVAQNLGIKSVPVKFIGEEAKPPAPPLTEALIKEGDEIVTKAEAIAPTNASVIEFRRLVEQAKAATTPEAQRQALLRMEALEDEIRAITKLPKEGNPGRVRFDRGDINSAITAAQRLKSDRDLYIFATYLGFTIDRGPPPGVQSYVVVHPDGSTDLYAPLEPEPPAVKAFIGPKTVIEYDRSYTLKELREMARASGLSASGSKKEIAAQLIARGGN